MLCKGCGKEIKEYQRFCTGCGLPVALQAEPPKAKPPQSASMPATSASPAKKKRSKAPLIILLILVCIGALGGGWFYWQTTTPTYLMDKGEQALIDEQYDVAWATFQKLINKEPNNIIAYEKMLEAGLALPADSRDNDRVLDIIDKVESDTRSPKRLEELNFLRVEVYTAMGDEANAQRLLETLLPQPSFEMPSGEYITMTPFTVQVPEGMSVYWMLDDDQMPTLYTQPITLAEGEHTVFAYAQDGQGRKGKTVSVNYSVIVQKIVINSRTQQVVEDFINDTLWLNILPEFQSVQELDFSKIAFDVFVNASKESSVKMAADYPGLTSEEGIYALQVEDVEKQAQRYFGSAYQMEHKNYGGYTYFPDHKIYVYNPTDWIPSPIAAVSDVEVRGSVLVAQVAFGITDSMYMTHPITRNVVRGYDYDMSETQLRNFTRSNQDALQMAKVSFAQDDEGNFYYLSCVYTN